MGEGHDEAVGSEASLHPGDGDCGPSPGLSCPPSFVWRQLHIALRVVVRTHVLAWHSGATRKSWQFSELLSKICLNFMWLV